MSTSYELAACPVCASTSATELLDHDAVKREIEQLWDFHIRRLKTGVPTAKLYDRVVFSQRFPLRVVQCNECDTVYRDPRESSRSVLELYAGEDVDSASLEALFEQQRESYRGPVQRLTRARGRAGSGLELGSYIGAFLAAAKDEGWDFQGIDINGRTNRFAEERGLRVTHGTLEEFEPHRTYDAVAIWNCLDQLPDPRGTLLKARSLLDREGILAIRIPNGALFAAMHRRMPRVLAPVARAILAYNNLLGFPYRNGFTHASLTRLVRSCGFERVSIHASKLVNMHDEHSRTWSKWEESLLMRGIGALRTQRLAPWFELYAHAACVKIQ
jgi:2-polyprenyl-3-methyl-5-hydroxy-6-metoxy-1,4-benzoquinol methylase